MDYIQRNPVPLPKGGKFQEVESTIQTVFDWEYALEEKKLLSLYEKGKSLAWNASDLAWDTEVDVAKISLEGGVGDFMNKLLDPPRKLTSEEAVNLRLHQNAFMLSQFLHGEQGALIASARIVETVPWAEAKYYAANQVSDEARHVEVYHRYLTEKLGISYEIHPSLQTLLDDIVSAKEWDMTYLGMQILVEGLALAAFGMMRMMMQSEPLIYDLTGRVMQDESRHVAFGVLTLQKLYKGGLTQTELKEREEFIIEGTHLLHDRLLMHQVFERMGWDEKTWVDWMTHTPLMRGFRQMMFSKIVPNLKRLGLLTPRVRAAYAKLDLLKFENGKDSVEEPEVQPPAEVMALLMQHLQAQNDKQNAPPASR
jgi:hypothetical protein